MGQTFRAIFFRKDAWVHYPQAIREFIRESGFEAVTIFGVDCWFAVGPSDYFYQYIDFDVFDVNEWIENHSQWVFDDFQH